MEKCRVESLACKFKNNPNLRRQTKKKAGWEDEKTEVKEFLFSCMLDWLDSSDEVTILKLCIWSSRGVNRMISTIIIRFLTDKIKLNLNIIVWLIYPVRIGRERKEDTHIYLPTTMPCHKAFDLSWQFYGNNFQHVKIYVGYDK